jgi:vacuolar-type H+-ATPase subunit H
MSQTGSNPPVAASPGADIALVMSTELELEKELTTAREEARILVEAAYTDAGARSSAQERELAAARELWQAEVEAERDRRATEVLLEGKRAAARFDEVAEGRVAELADIVVARLLRGAD